MFRIFFFFSSFLSKEHSFSPFPQEKMAMNKGAAIEQVSSEVNELAEKIFLSEQAEFRKSAKKSKTILNPYSAFILGLCLV